jgi:hypothetical protein
MLRSLRTSLNPGKSRTAFRYAPVSTRVEPSSRIRISRGLTVCRRRERRHASKYAAGVLYTGTTTVILAAIRLLRSASTLTGNERVTVGDDGAGFGALAMDVIFVLGLPTIAFACRGLSRRSLPRRSPELSP